MAKKCLSLSLLMGHRTASEVGFLALPLRRVDPHTERTKQPAQPDLTLAVIGCEHCVPPRLLCDTVRGGVDELGGQQGGGHRRLAHLKLVVTLPQDGVELRAG